LSNFDEKWRKKKETFFNSSFKLRVRCTESLFDGCLNCVDLRMENIEHQRVRYSQSSIKPYFSDGRTSVETWMDALPYSVPLEVMNIDGEAYVSSDSIRLYSARIYGLNPTVKCKVYNAHEPVTSIMQDHGLDLLTVIWSNENILHRLSLRANTIEAVIIIRCAVQNTNFPFLGSDIPPRVSHQRIYDDITKKIVPASVQFIESQENYLDYLENVEEIYVRPVPNVNIYHQRNDLVRLILDRPDLFNLMRYDRCMGFTLRARGEKDPDVWDNWDDLLATASEAECEREDSYLLDFFNSVKVYC